MPKHEAAHITFETYIGYGVLQSIWCNLHLIDQRIVVREWLRYVTSFVITCSQLCDIYSTRSTCGCGPNLSNHVDICCVAECREFL